MAPWPPCVEKEHRRGAWVLYSLLVSLFITYVTVTIVQAVKARDNPPVSINYKLEDPLLPSFTICPTSMTTDGFRDFYDFLDVQPWCKLILDSVKNKEFVPKEIDLRTFRSHGIQYAVAPNSNCHISVVDNPSEASAPCFRYQTGDFFADRIKGSSKGVGFIALKYRKVARNNTAPDRGDLVSIGPAYFDDALLFLSYEHYRGVNGSEGRSVDTAGYFRLPSGRLGLTNGILSFTQRKFLNESTETTISGQFTQSPLDVTINDTTALYFFVDRTGTLVIEEKNPISVTLLIAQFGGVYTLMVAVFSSFYAADEVRKPSRPTKWFTALILSCPALVGLRAKSEKKESMAKHDRQTPLTEEGWPPDLYPASEVPTSSAALVEVVRRART